MRSPARVASVAEPSRRLTFIAALYNRDFRYLWVATICSASVQRVEGVVLGWLVLEMTHSAFLVGLVTAVRRLGALLGPWAGVVADRVDRRRLALLAITLMTLIVALLTALVMARRLDVWHLFAAAIVSGVAWAFFQPAQQSIQADILQQGTLANGISLTNMAMNIATIGGPILGGMVLACCRPERRVWDWSDADMVLSLNSLTFYPQRLYATTSEGRVMLSNDLGISWEPAPFGLPRTLTSAMELGDAATGVQLVYVAMLLLFLLQLASFLMMHPPPRTRSRAVTSIWQNLREGLRFSRQEPGLWTPLVLAGLVNFAAFPMQQNLLPVFARDIFNVGASGLGWLGAAVGIGALVGSFLMIRLGAMHRAGTMMLVGTFLWSLFQLLFGFVPSYELGLVVMACSGVVQAMCLTNITIMLLNTSTTEMRGRVMGLRSLAVAPLFLGGMLSGAAAEHFGAPVTAILCGGVGTAVTLCVAPWVPRRGGE